jgi:hypothetical protein
MNDRDDTIRKLRKRRPRDRFVRTSLWIVAALVALAWFTTPCRAHSAFPRWTPPAPSP